MSKSIVKLVDELPTDNITVKVLKTLDNIVPGKWENLVGFDKTITAVTGTTKAKEIEKIRDRAIELYNDKNNGYQRALWLYQTVDSMDKAAGAAALADKIGDTFRFIPFLDKLTPKADKIQTVDFCLKLAVEIITYRLLNEISLNPLEFSKALKEKYRHEALIRMGALVCIDGIIPLGPDFIAKIQNSLESGNISLEKNPSWENISQFIPGNDKQGFIIESFKGFKNWMVDISKSMGITRESLSKNMGSFIDIADDRLDYLAAFLDMSVNYFSHTGTQTVARSIITRAYNEIKND